MRIRDYLTRSGQQSRQHSQSRRGLDQKKNLSKAQLNARRLILESLEHRNLMAVVWAAGAELPQARVDAAAVVGADEAVYILGGNSNNVDVLQAGATNWESGGAIDKERVSAGVGALADGRILLFGGSTLTGPGGTGLPVEFNDTWVWNGSTWSQKFPTSSPPPRSRGSMAYDVSKNRLVLYGGTSNSGTLGGLNGVGRSTKCPPHSKLSTHDFG